MNVGILGSGDVAKSLAGGFLNHGHEAMLGEVRRVPSLPRRHLGLEGRVPGCDPLGVDPRDLRPVGGPEVSHCDGGP